MSVDPQIQAIFGPLPKGRKPMTEEQMRVAIIRLLEKLRESPPRRAKATDVDTR